MPSLIRTIVRKFKQLTAGLREKPEVEVEEYDLEHFLLYHGLVGSTPENQREYRDVRADLIEAVNHDSCSELARALKLQPLIWEHRLQKIFSEIVEANPKGAVRCLLALEYADSINVECDPLRHPDWRVRANAAKMLGFIGAHEAVDRLIVALDACIAEHKTAFCHIAQALGTLGGEKARAALVKHLYNEETWFRVDAAAALACSSLDDCGAELMEAVQHEHRLSEYMAAVICRRHPPAAFFDSGSDAHNDGACQMAFDLLAAVNGPFRQEHAIAAALEECSDRVNIAAGRQPTPRRLRAAIDINEWLGNQRAFLNDLSNSQHAQAVMEVLNRKSWSGGKELSELRHALALAGKFKLSAGDLLADKLDGQFVMLDALIEALGDLEYKNAAGKIIAITEALPLHIEQRCKKELSPQPVLEAEPAAALTYWTALKALGYMPTTESWKFLLRSANDYASDKREQAVLSLQRLAQSPELAGEAKSGLSEVLAQRLSDTSTAVCQAALVGVESTDAIEHVSDCLRLLNSLEGSLQRQSKKTLLTLAENGHSQDVVAAAQTAMGRETDANKRQRLAALVSQLS